MWKIDKSQLTKNIHFPKTQAQPTQKVKGFWRLLKSWATFKRFYLILENYIIWSEYLQAYVFIPAKFLTDLASVPKMFNSFFKSDGLLLMGAFPHDFGYKFQGLILVNSSMTLYFKPFKRAEIDIIFEKFCAWESGLPKSAKLAKSTLTPTGWKPWDKYVKENNTVEKLFPELL